ncbi:small ribosomal subunit protein uS3m-like [Haliotis cracherodii]|uniref:small ribosomal subunit protein uS3m-like n=1 Tax=Haliotis cracherodii TaxID=6455 RepID=UPI0039ED1457
MASVLCQVRNRVPCLIKLAELQLRGVTTTACVCKNIRSGVPKISVKGDKALTYEEANPPHMIGVRKSWNTWNTSNLKGEGRKAETTVDDIFIRRFIKGTFPTLVASEVIIKRRHNIITITTMMYQSINAQKMYFLWGYTEEILSYFLKCPVKLEIQTITNKSDIIYKHI